MANLESPYEDLTSREIMTGITPYPVKEIMDIPDWRGRQILDLGPGSLKTLDRFSKQLGGETKVTGIDINREYKEAYPLKLIYNNYPIVYFHGDLANPQVNPIISEVLYYEKVIEISKEVPDSLSSNPLIGSIVTAVNLFVNLPNPRAQKSVAAAIAATLSISTFHLKKPSFAFIRDHSRKDRRPHGNVATWMEYKRRYQEGLEVTGVEGVTWTDSPPPRYVKHYTENELHELFPSRFFFWIRLRPLHFLGDSGKTTNAFLLVLRAKCHPPFTVNEVLDYYNIPKNNRPPLIGFEEDFFEEF